MASFLLLFIPVGRQIICGFIGRCFTDWTFIHSLYEYIFRYFNLPDYVALFGKVIGIGWLVGFVFNYFIVSLVVYAWIRIKNAKQAQS